ncbi:MAG: ABC transporter permease [Gammaproteobacteria bacterium]|nr:ABC transporter permease [Gammaproteobacteria bacterium]
MSYLSLLWANLFRKKTRTVLTLLSVMIAFVLFVLLQAVGEAFTGGVTIVGVDRLIVTPKYSIVDELPLSQKRQVAAIAGVNLVTQQSWFGGVYQDPKNFFPKYPVEPLEYFDMYSEFIINPAELEAFAGTRTGAVVKAGLAEQYGWKLGDIIPIQADIWPKADGSRTWEFELVGTFEEAESSRPLFLFQYQYFTESVELDRRDQVGWWTVRLSEPERAAEIAREIDSLFENSRDPTRTATEDEFSRQFASQLGDIGFITTIIMSAVFFTIVLLTGNTMAQALRERIPELAVLKTIGFTDTAVSALVLGEAIVLCVVGGLCGIAMAYLLLPGIAPVLESFAGSIDFSATTLATAIGLSVVIGIVIGIVPAMSARRLTIVDALRKN